VLVELGVVEQRYRAVLEVLDEGTSVTEVARRYGVARQTVHEWLARYAAGGLAGLADRSSAGRRIIAPDPRPWPGTQAGGVARARPGLSQ
jgi:transposase-like protein